MSTETPIVDCPGRMFQLWMFKPGHTQMLFRSTGTPARGLSQIDVVFKNVVYCEIAPVIRSLAVFEPDEAQTALLKSRNASLSAAIGKASHVFVIRGEGFQGLVAATFAKHIEYEGDSRQRSPVMI